MAMLIVNEKSPLRMTMVFTDFDGDPLIPTTVEWRLDDKTNDAEVVGWTVLPSPAATMVVVIPGDNNTIEDDANVKELQIFGVRVDEGLAGEAHTEFAYDVLNLSGPTGP
ncbi:hypothetical protein LCGC14_0468650 [marine sediment metagenome]|uniref:Uncharacterized protein n=1 Tax=marine sediment metagenome TaxID=412755 RepID=A0A0F9SI80_9ZZZZ